jgi:hypothetical protein
MFSITLYEKLYYKSVTFTQYDNTFKILRLYFDYWLYIFLILK